MTFCLIRCFNGDTLFHVAASTGNIEAIEIFLQQEVDCNVLNSRGATPLHVAKNAAIIEVWVDINFIAYGYAVP